MPVYDVDEEVHVGRRAFGEAQDAFRDVPSARLDNFVDVGWYGTETHPEAGAFALVREGGPLEYLVGEILAVTRDVSADPQPTFVYVVGALPIPDDLALYRRAFLNFSGLFNDTVRCVVEVI